MASIARSPRSLSRQGIWGSNFIDRIFRSSTLLLALSIPVLMIALLVILSVMSAPSIHYSGWRFLTASIWDAVHSHYGILFAIYGTLVSSLLALLFAIPISLGAAICLSELAPRWLRNPVSFLIELLAAVPSIVYGLWGIFVLVPFLRVVETWLGERLGYIPLFQGSVTGYGMLTAGMILAIMILPYITSVSREVLTAVPSEQREAAYALGATRWEALRGPVLRYARSGIMGAIILGLGRALGETMAVTMVIGNRAEISSSLFSPGYTLPSLLANEFVEASDHLQTASLVEAALILVVITLIINSIARLMIWKAVKAGQTEARA